MCYILPRKVSSNIRKTDDAYEKIEKCAEFAIVIDRMAFSSRREIEKSRPLKRNHRARKRHGFAANRRMGSMILIATMIDDVNDREFMYGVYENNKLLMIAIARRYSDNEHDCEDIVHDTVERLCGKVKKLRGFSEYTLKAYIAHSVRNVALNHQRHQAVIARHAEDFAEESYEPETPYTKLERIEDLDEARAKLVAVWDKLPESDRDILYRKYVFE